MKTVQLPNSTDYHELYTLSGYTQPTSLIVTNNTSKQIRVYQSTTAPSSNSLIGLPVWPNSTCLIHGNDTVNIYVKGSSQGYIIVQELTSTVTPFTSIEFPQDIVTSGVEGFRRLQVDDGQTGFFEQREFRIIRKLSLSANQTLTFKLSCTNDFILFDQAFAISEGNFEVYFWNGSNVTENTQFTTSIPIIRKNNSSEYRDYGGQRYQSVMSIQTGGTITLTDSNLYEDYIGLVTAGGSAQKISINGPDNSERYFAAGDYYFQIINSQSASTGQFSLDWEERPVGVK